MDDSVAHARAGAESAAAPDGIAPGRAGVDRRLLIGLVIALAVQALFVFSYVGALHSPTASPGCARSGRFSGAAGCRWEELLVEDGCLPERDGCVARDRRAEGRRRRRRRPGRSEALRRSRSRPGRCSSTRRGVRRRGRRFSPEDRGRSGSSIAEGRRCRDRAVPAHHGIGRRRLPVGDDGDGARRTVDTPATRSRARRRGRRSEGSSPPRSPGRSSAPSRRRSSSCSGLCSS